MSSRSMIAMVQLSYKRLGICVLLGLLFCYVILAFSCRFTKTGSSGGFFSSITRWPFHKKGNFLTRALKPIVHNATWHGKPLQNNFSTHLWFTQFGDLQLMSKAMVSGGLNISALAAYSQTVLPLDAPEVQFLVDPPLTDPLSAANESTSRLVILDPPKHYRVGDSLHVKIEVYDGRGRRLFRGGDQIRIWAVDPAQQASFATDVIDLGNGTYFASLPLNIPGDFHIKSGLTFNREVLRAISFVKSAVRTTKFIAAGFFSDFGNAATLCSTYPFVPGGYEDICDLSEQNGGLPWYCGRPSNPALSCNHWTHVADIQFVQPLPLTGAEKLWMQWLDVPKNLRIVNNFQFLHEPSILQQGLPLIKVEANPPVQNVSPKPLCIQTKFEDTWRDTSPRGFWLKQTWTPLTCTLPTLVATRVTTCLKDTTVLLLGDSNLRLALAILKDLTGCELDTKGEVNLKWHRPMRCVNTKTKTEIRWRTHAHPFHTGQLEWSDRKDQKAVHEYIDEVPEAGKFIVIVHLYLHFTTELLSVFQAHIRAVRQAVERLLLRNPLATVIIRAPHSASQFWPTAYSTDSFAWALTQILKTEFDGLYDNVLFIQPWDMTVAAENVDSHPPEYINRAIINMMLSHIC